MVTVYAVYLYAEPILTILYAWILFRIKRSKVEELRSPFFVFFVGCGIAACMNILIISLKRFENELLPVLVGKKLQDLIFNLLVFGSHSFSFTHTVGKTLVLASRFTAICFPMKHVWTQFRLNLANFLMFVVPAVIYSFMIPLKACYRNNQYGNYIYIGVDDWAQRLSKLISASSYLLFIVVSTPMCVASIYHLRKAQQFNRNAFAAHERALLFYAIAIATAHLVKSAQQVFWFITIEFDNQPLFDMATSMYNIANALTTFVPPLLLVATSKVVRFEIVCGCLGRRFRYNPTVGNSAFRSSSNQESAPNQEAAPA